MAGIHRGWDCDFLVIGSGIAGLSFALEAAEMGEVVVVTKKELNDTATNLAQGGIACVSAPDDSFDLHIQDTLRAGDGLCHEGVVETIVKGAPERIAQLERYGVPFARDPKNPDAYDLGMEGGHCRRRIVRVEDFTGRSIQSVLIERAMEHPKIRLLPHHVAVDLITQGKLRRTPAHHEICMGAYCLSLELNEIYPLLAPVTVLATGGAGKIYLYTSNPDVASGAGIAMAYRAGARVANLEFVQFHPTCLYHPKAKNFLISEALRGEGAILIDAKGHRFMERYDPERMELSSRDIVARAIDAELKKSGDDCVFLDITHRDRAFLEGRFPNIYRRCLELGIDMATDPIPVVPAAHYMCGGVVTDPWGRTDIGGLFAVGECACTGLHGANRLASNSLLEGLVMAHRAAEACARELSELKSACPEPEVPAWDTGGAVDMDEGVLISHNWDTIRRLMWNYVGIVRSVKRLKLAREQISPILDEIDRHYWDYILTRDFIELRNLAQTADLVIEAASRRRESRGGHFIVDYPGKNDWEGRCDTILKWEFPRPESSEQG